MGIDRLRYTRVTGSDGRGACRAGLGRRRRRNQRSSGGGTTLPAACWRLARAEQARCRAQLQPSPVQPVACTRSQPAQPHAEHKHSRTSGFSATRAGSSQKVMLPISRPATAHASSLQARGAAPAAAMLSVGQEGSQRGGLQQRQRQQVRSRRNGSLNSCSLQGRVAQIDHVVKYLAGRPAIGKLHHGTAGQCREGRPRCRAAGA
jgi:hypothetical protein